MSPATVREKIQKIESELELLKRSVVSEPDFDIDEKTWQKMQPEIKSTRKAQYRKLYDKK